MKTKGATHILAKFGDLNKKIYYYGASQKEGRYDDEGLVNVKKTKCVIMPDSKLK